MREMAAPAMAISAAACRAWGSRVVNPARNAELAGYQARLGDVRRQLAAERVHLPSKAAAQEARRELVRDERAAAWQQHVTAVKGRIGAALGALHGNYAPKHHPCRPTVEHAKTEEERRAGCGRLEAALRPHLLMRRKYIRYLSVVDKDVVSRDCLDERIEHAIAHPTNPGVAPERLVAEEMAVRTRLRLMNVADGAGRLKHKAK